jgi:hypothetical protein
MRSGCQQGGLNGVLEFSISFAIGSGDTALRQNDYGPDEALRDGVCVDHLEILVNQ